MKFLIENSDAVEVQSIQEANDKSLYITGPFIQMDVVNGNKRLYPSEYIPNSIEKYIQEKVVTDRAVGELNHPTHPEPNYERACIKINELRREGSNYIGKAKVLESLPMGAIVAGLIREGVKIGVSSRAVGSLKKRADGVSIVQPDYRLTVAADVVADPSAPDAFVTALMESKDWVYENGVLREHECKQIVDKHAMQGINESTLKAIFREVIGLIK